MMMRRWWLGFIRVQATIVVVMLLAIVLVTLANVLLRTWGPGSLPWADEFARITFVMFSFLSAALACGFGAHLVVSGIADKTRGLTRRLLTGFQAAVAGGFFLTLIVLGFSQATSTSGQSTPALGFPTAVIYGTVAVSGILMLLNSILATTVGAVAVHDARLVLGHERPDLEEIA